MSAGNTLMKALTICEGGEFLEKVDWKDRYIGYNMLSNGVKPKKLKKGRKINKPKK